MQLKCFSDGQLVQDDEARSSRLCRGLPDSKLPLTRHPEPVPRTDVLVSGNLTVPILGESCSPILVPANPPSVILSGHVALRRAGNRPTAVVHFRRS
jgi:hypothetical protein